ncbi:hypothetical protein SAK_0731 [Streptococcus agalactiae A909]|nr:hypothetical protein SAK_0731 [Streptococcus agalactiae A909]
MSSTPSESGDFRSDSRGNQKEKIYQEMNTKKFMD